MRTTANSGRFIKQEKIEPKSNAGGSIDVLADADNENVIPLKRTRNDLSIIGHEDDCLQTEQPAPKATDAASTRSSSFVTSRQNKSLTSNAQILKSLPQSITVRKTQRTLAKSASTLTPTTTATSTIANAAVNPTRLSMGGVISSSTSARPVVRNCYSSGPVKRGSSVLQTATPAMKRTLNAAPVEDAHAGNNNRNNLSQDIEMRIKNARRETSDSNIMKIGEKRVKVQKIMVTKSEAAALAKEGRIQYKDGNMILKGASSAIKRTLNK